MTVMLLISRTTGEPVAELTREKEIKIYNESLLDLITNSGIAVPRDFKEKYKSGWYVYPTDDKVLFARAFEQIYYKQGLQQQGYFWKNKDENIP